LEVQYKSANGRLFIKVDGNTQKEVFEKLAAAIEVFEAADKCGCCGSTIRPRVRHVAKGNKTFDYYEMACQEPRCHARLAFGQSTDTVSLFPKRKNETGEWLPNGGWSKYQPTDDK
jgi:hypothetical protein